MFADIYLKESKQFGSFILPRLYNAIYYIILSLTLIGLKKWLRPLFQGFSKRDFSFAYKNGRADLALPNILFLFSFLIFNRSYFRCDIRDDCFISIFFSR